MLTKQWIRLLNILKSDEELLKDIEELKFWCYITGNFKTDCYYE
jgi:hypothetical protein